MAKSRAISMHQLYNTKFEDMDFKGRWLRSLGRPEITGSWIIYGPSGHGKTRFVVQLCKYLTKFGGVVYDSLEEGNCKSFQDTCVDFNMIEVAANFHLLDQEQIEDLKIRLKKRKSPRFAVVDSVQYSGISYKDHKELKAAFRSKVLIYISHSKGKKPDGYVANKIEYDSFIKIRVEGFIAFIVSRYGGQEPFVIWREGAERYWGADHEYLQTA